MATTARDLWAPIYLETFHVYPWQVEKFTPAEWAEMTRILNERVKAQRKAANDARRRA